jgi:Tol biopolymer transport system component
MVPVLGNSNGKKLLVWVLGLVVIVPLVRAQQAGQPNGGQRKIVFDSDRDGNPEIYAMDPDGSNPQRLTDSKGSDETPAWSPDRKKIAFASDREGHLDIYVMDPDGSNPQRLRTMSRRG